MEINLLKYFTVKRGVNTLKIVSSFWVSRLLRRPIVWGMPVSFSIEPTNHCNLKCPECPSGLGELTRPLGLLKFNEFKKIVDQIYETGFYLQLYFQGEPFINKQLSLMIQYAQAKNMYVSISTNGHFITEKNINEILEFAPDKLIFSIDGLDESTYSKYRVGGTFKQADNGLKLLCQKKNEAGVNKPYVELQFIVMKQNEHQIKEVITYGDEAGVDKVTLKTMQVTSYQSAVNFLPSNPKFRRYILNENSIKVKNKLKNHCFALWRTSVITWDGKVVPCCFDKDADYTLGLLNGKTFREIWLSENYRGFRKDILKNRKGINMCTNCTAGLNMNILEIEQ